MAFGATSHTVRIAMPITTMRLPLYRTSESWRRSTRFAASPTWMSSVELRTTPRSEEVQGKRHLYVDSTKLVLTHMVGTPVRPRCFRGATPNQLGLDYEAVKKAWMESAIFSIG